VKGATCEYSHPVLAIPNFNPRTREGCDLNKVIENVGGEIISIHAPVKGATARKVVEILFLIGISIHAPVKGAT